MRAVLVLCALLALALRPAAVAAARVQAQASATGLAATARAVPHGGQLAIQRIKLPGQDANATLELERFSPFAPGAVIAVQVGRSCGTDAPCATASKSAGAGCAVQ